MDIHTVSSVHKEIYAAARGTMKRIAWKMLATLLVTIACALPAVTLQLYGLSVDRFEAASGVTTAGSTATFKLPGAADLAAGGAESAAKAKTPGTIVAE